MLRILRWVGLVVLLIGFLSGAVVYHHVRGPKFVVRLAPTSAPAVPTYCRGPCARSWKQAVWFRGTVTNVGHRGGNLVCTAQVFDFMGRKVHDGYIPTWSFPGGPFLEAGETHTWQAQIYFPPKRPPGPIERLVGSCDPIDYHGRVPI